MIYLDGHLLLIGMRVIKSSQNGTALFSLVPSHRTFPSGYFSKLKEIYMRDNKGRDVTKIFKILHHNLFNSKRITT